DDYLVTLGITPTSPSTEYGYIQQSGRLGQVEGFPVYRAARFVEKPDLARAQEMLAEGGYSWNSGMFMWKVSAILEQFRVQMTGLYDQILRIGKYIGKPEYNEILAQVWPQIHKDTIDYGVMEKATRVAVVPVDMEWTDVGNWNSLKERLPEDADGNNSRGDNLLLDCHDTLVLGEGERLIAAIGLEDLIVVDTPDALLVCHKDHVQDVRKIVAKLREQGRDGLV
ncbi:MAG: sugar phosphate nucleotidyltransferase, partial [Anaerolineaceae bacterium]